MYGFALQGGLWSEVGVPVEGMSQALVEAGNRAVKLQPGQPES